MEIKFKLFAAPPFFEVECTGIQNAFHTVRRLLQKKEEKEEFSRYFRLVGDERPMDICVFQLLIRHPLPVMDLFYLEYLSWLIRHKKILQLLIVSTEDDYFPGQQVDVWEKHRANIAGIFAGNVRQVTIMNAKEAVKATNTSELLSKDLYDLLEYVSHDFLKKEIREPFGLGVTHFSEYNMHHPEKLRLEATYRHLTGGYVVWRYLISQGIIPKERVVVGHLVWEAEVDKLGVSHKMVVEAGHELSVVLCKTVMIDWWRCIPNREKERTVYLHEDLEETVQKLNGKSTAELEQYVRLFKTILNENYSKDPAATKASRISRLPTTQAPKNALVQIVMDHMDCLRNIYRRPGGGSRCEIRLMEPEGTPDNALVTSSQQPEIGGGGTSTS